jgi:penicillin amidase
VTHVGTTLFNEFVFDLIHDAMHDELGDGFFDSLLATRVINAALPRLVADPDSPWWDNRNTPAKETRADIVKQAWHESVSHLKTLYGSSADEWQWGRIRYSTLAPSRHPELSKCRTTFQHALAKRHGR